MFSQNILIFTIYSVFAVRKKYAAVRIFIAEVLLLQIVLKIKKQFGGI